MKGVVISLRLEESSVTKPFADDASVFLNELLYGNLRREQQGPSREFVFVSSLLDEDGELLYNPVRLSHM